MLRVWRGLLCRRHVLRPFVAMHVVVLVACCVLCAAAVVAVVVANVRFATLQLTLVAVAVIIFIIKNAFKIYQYLYSINTRSKY